MSNLSPRHLLKTLSSVRSPCSPLPLAFHQFVSRPHCSTIGREVVFDKLIGLPLCKVYWPTVSKVTKVKIKYKKKRPFPDRATHSLHAHARRGSYTSVTSSSRFLWASLSVEKYVCLKYTQKIYFYIADLFYYLGLIFLWKSSWLHAPMKCIKFHCFKYDCVCSDTQQAPRAPTQTHTHTSVGPGTNHCFCHGGDSCYCSCHQTTGWLHIF